MRLLFGKIIACAALFACLPFGGRAQSLDQAKKLYNEGAYGEARPAFEKLVRQSPSNPSYNQWYGVCCFETGDFALAEKHLLIANGRDIAESYRYLANIYTASYRFAEAVGMWEGYIAHLTKKKENTDTYEAQLAYVEKLLRMKEKMEDVQVIDSIVVPVDRLLSAYFLSRDCGTLLSGSDFFGSTDSQTTVYVNPKGDQAYYGRLDENGRYALYTQSRLMDTWTDESPVFASDTSDNNYPFVRGDGVTLYFASKGNGSIGGYDLFVTRYKNNTFLAPEQMGMPFNSTANDYLMVVDETKETGWFVSDRNQPEGKVCIYLFIPDESRRRIAVSDDDLQLCRRAMLASIKETWQPGLDYSELIDRARTDEMALAIPQRPQDFVFVVNDQTTFYTWADFKSAEAENAYRKAESMRRQIESTEQKLNELRDKYTAGNDAERSQLKPSILKSEEELATLHAQINGWIKKARNTENKH
ncbi:MAG: tetratricopeptide repeat protein [Tannerella sp.]|jgi:tetratricopeptide (TPR) repeat protein|nr:tetratricopeptide repeat protein [Tannerella sp.]